MGWVMEVEERSGSPSEKHVGVESVKRGSEGEGSLLAAVGSLDGGVSIGRPYCLSERVFLSMMFFAGVGGGESEGDVRCTLVVERVGGVEGDDGSSVGSILLLLADWTPSDSSPL